MVTEKPTRDPELNTRVLPDGHVVVHNKRTNRAYTLSPLAALVWEYCDGTNTVADILDYVRKTEGVPSDTQLSEEVTVLLSDFEESGIILPEE